MIHSSREPESIRTDGGSENGLCPAAVAPLSSEGEPERPTPTLKMSREELEYRSLQVVGQSFEWLRAHEQELLKQHPEWDGQCAAVSNWTASKILAVAADRIKASEAALQSPELHELAEREGMPAGYLFCIADLGTTELLLDLCSGHF